MEDEISECDCLVDPIYKFNNLPDAESGDEELDEEVEEELSEEEEDFDGEEERNGFHHQHEDKLENVQQNVGMQTDKICVTKGEMQSIHKDFNSITCNKGINGDRTDPTYINEEELQPVHTNDECICCNNETNVDNIVVDCNSDTSIQHNDQDMSFIANDKVDETYEFSSSAVQLDNTASVRTAVIVQRHNTVKRVGVEGVTQCEGATEINMIKSSRIEDLCIVNNEQVDLEFNNTQKRSDHIVQDDLPVTANNEQCPDPPVKERKNLSQKLVRKKVIRLPRKKRHSRTIFYEDILSAYDIIDRTDVKEIKDLYKNNLMFSFARLAARLSHTFSSESKSVPSTFDADRKNPPSSFTAAPNAVVTFSLEKANDGEPMQVINLSHFDDDLQASQKNNIAIHVDTLPDDDSVLNISDIESDKSNISEDEHDVVDSLHSQKKVYNNVRANENKDSSPSESYKKTLSRTSQSFKIADKSQHHKMEPPKNYTLSGTIQFRNIATSLGSFLPVVTDEKQVKKKSLSNEPFFMRTDGYPTNFPSFPSDRRSLIALEMYTTERTFVRGLEVAVMVCNLIDRYLGYCCNYNVSGIITK